MAKLLYRTVLLCCLVFNKSPSAEPCTRLGYFGDSCLSACSEGCPLSVEGDSSGLTQCDKTTGDCTFGQSEQDKKCEDGWGNSDSSPKQCKVPQCFGKDNNCGEGGDCVAPNICICGRSGAQTVAMKGKFMDTAKSMEVDGYNCVSLRKTGIKGAFIALLVMVVSIGSCGLIERSINGDNVRKRRY